MNKDFSKNRAGNYIHQPQGRAFIPAPLPPDPPVQFDDALIMLLSRASLALGRLDGSTQNLPNPDLFVGMYVNKEAVRSSQIEGTQASLIDVLEFKADAAEPKNLQDIEEIVNYINALKYGLERLETLPLSLRLIREIHERLMAGVRGSEKRPGEFRTEQNWIGSPGSPRERATFVPPPPREMMDCLYDLEKFLYAAAPLPPLIKIGLIHAQFETIHPFLDGNGRIGRLLITFILCQHHILKQPLLYLSHYFKLNQQQYYESLQRVHDAGDWENWLAFFLRGVYEVAEAATETAHNILQMRERHHAFIRLYFGRMAKAGATLLEYLYQMPIITVNSAAEITGQTFQNASKLIGRFQEHGMLREMTQQARNRRFMYAEYLALLASEELPASLQTASNKSTDMTQSNAPASSV